MRKIILNIHSFIDVITNSSTEIFVSTHGKTEEMAKELIDKVLKAAGSDKKAEDIFTYQVEKMIYDDEGEEDEKWIPEEEETPEGWHETDYDDNTKQRLVITAKNDSAEVIDLCDYLEGMLAIDASYNG